MDNRISSSSKFGLGRLVVPVNDNINGLVIAQVRDAAENIVRIGRVSTGPELQLFDGGVHNKIAHLNLVGAH